MTDIAYSYIRFSTREQRKGHSLRRQIEAARGWCDRRKVRLDTSVTLHDLGKSAYLGDHRKNPDRFALAAFLKLVEDDKIPRGSYLIVESLDRLTREHVRAALMLCLGLIEKGVRIVQLSPTELVYDETADEMSLMLMIVELSRGHRESKRKSDLSGPAWAKKKRGAKDGKLVTERLPEWIRLEEGRMVLIPERAEVVQTIFHLASNGYGTPRVVTKLRRDRVPPFGKKLSADEIEKHVRYREEKGHPLSELQIAELAEVGRWGHEPVDVVDDEGQPVRKWKPTQWGRGYVGKILRDRRALGEYQPRKGKKRVVDGDPVPGYFPAVVSEKEFNAARGGAAERGSLRGRTGAEHVNVFSGLLRNVRKGDTYFLTQRHERSAGVKKVYPTLVNTGSQAGDPCFAFSYSIFERGFLALLAEVDPKEVVGNGHDRDEVLGLSGELAQTEARIKALEKELEEGDVPSIARALRKQEGLKVELSGKLATARARSPQLLAEGWEECQSLLRALDDSPDPEDTRLRLRSALRRIVADVWMLVIPKKIARLAFFQVRFKKDAGVGTWREYFLYHRPPHHSFGGRKAGFWIALAVSDLDLPGKRRTHDLRRYASDEKTRDYFDALAGRLLPACEKNHANALKMKVAWDKAKEAGIDLDDMEPEGNEGEEHACYGLLP